MLPTQSDRWPCVGPLLLVCGAMGQFVLAYVVCLMCLVYLLSSCGCMSPITVFGLLLLLQGPLLVALGLLWVTVIQPSLEWYFSACP